MKRLLSFLPAFVAIVFPFLYVQACGPFFFDDVFVQKIHPDHPSDFAAGKLGVLLPTYPRADLAVAYRYLSAKAERTNIQRISPFRAPSAMRMPISRGLRYGVGDDRVNSDGAERQGHSPRDGQHDERERSARH